MFLLWVSCCLARSTGISPELHRNLTRISPEFHRNFLIIHRNFTRIHRNLTRIHQNFTGIPNWSTLKRGITTTRPSHTGSGFAKSISLRNVITQAKYTAPYVVLFPKRNGLWVWVSSTVPDVSLQSPRAPCRGMTFESSEH